MPDQMIRRVGQWTNRRDLITSVSLALLRERERWPLWLPVLLGAGIGLYFASPFEPSLAWAGVATSLSLACMFALLGTNRTSLRIVFSVVAAVAVGFVLAKVRTEFVAAPVLERRV